MKITKKRIKQFLIAAQVVIWGSFILATIDLREQTPFSNSIVEILWLFVPFIFLVNFNWYFLAPRFLKRGSYLRYALFVLVTIIGCAIILTQNPYFVEQNEMYLMMSGSGTKYLIPGLLTMSYVTFMAYLISMPFYLSIGWFDQQGKIDKLESENLRAELSILKDQINPHFFFNTLNNLYSLTLNKSEQAPEAMLKLSELMRYVIYDAKKPLVTIQEEVEYLENYFEIQRIRIGDKAEIEFTCEIDDPSTKVVPLLFINLIENAFKHGTDSMVKGGDIECTLKVKNGRLEFNVKNEYELKESKESGVGLTNLERRLALIYPDRHSLTITDGKNTFYVSLVIEKTDDLSNS